MYSASEEPLVVFLGDFARGGAPGPEVIIIISSSSIVNDMCSISSSSSNKSKSKNKSSSKGSSSRSSKSKSKSSSGATGPEAA